MKSYIVTSILPPKYVRISLKLKLSYEDVYFTEKNKIFVGIIRGQQHRLMVDSCRKSFMTSHMGGLILDYVRKNYIDAKFLSLNKIIGSFNAK